MAKDSGSVKQHGTRLYNWIQKTLDLTTGVPKLRLPLLSIPPSPDSRDINTRLGMQTSAELKHGDLRSTNHVPVIEGSQPCHHHHHHHHKHQGLDRVVRSVSRVTAALSNVSSVFQLFSFHVVCSSMISKAFGFVAFKC